MSDMLIKIFSIVEETVTIKVKKTDAVLNEMEIC